MKKTLLRISAFFMFLLTGILCPESFAQVKIGGIAGPPDPTAVLELDGGSTRGLLLPRMRKIDMLAIVEPAEGLVLYTTDEEALYLRRNGAWVKITQSADAFALPYAGSFDNATPVLSLTNTNPSGGAIHGISNQTNSIALRGNTTLGTGVAGFASVGIAGFFNCSNNSGSALIATGGRVGLGTAIPEGFLTIDGSTSGGNTVTINDSEDPLIQIKKAGVVRGFIQALENDIKIGTNVENNTGRFIIRTNAVDRVFVDNAGHLGIGSVASGARLYVDATGTASTAMIINDQNPTLQFQNSGVDKGALQLNGDDIRLGTNVANGSGNVVLRTKGLDRVWLDSNGSVTIGSGYENHGVLNVNGGGITIDNDFNTGTGPAIYFQKSYGPNSSLFMGVIYASTNYMRFTVTARGYEFGDQTATTFLRISPNTGYTNVTDRLGIGIDNPTAKFYINAVGDATQAMAINGANPVIQLLNNSVSKGYIQADGNDMVLAANVNNASGRVILRTADVDRVLLDNAGNVAIGGTPPPPGNKLAVKGAIAATAFNVVALAAWPDYVFDKSYKLATLDETENFITANKHLPGIPAAAEIEKNGYEISDMQKRMMEKIEELTLHLIEANKRIKLLEQKLLFN